MVKGLSNEESNKIRNMSFVCALLVVTIHIPYDTTMYNGSWFVYEFVKQGISRIAVPYFFVVSGYFLGRHFGEENWWRTACVNRVHTLLIPYLCWSILYPFWTVPLGAVVNILGGRAIFENLVVDLPGFPRWFGLDITNQPMLWPLWYVRMLMMLTLTSPIFKRMLERCAAGVMAISFSFMVLWTYLPVNAELFGYGISPVGIFYWMVGLCLATDRMSSVPKISGLQSLVIGSVLLILRVGCTIYCKCAEPIFYALQIPFLLYAVWTAISQKKWNEKIVSASFAIYVMHPCWFTWVWVLGRNLSIDAKCTMMILVGIIAPIVSAMIIKKIPRVAGKMLFGGR